MTKETKIILGVTVAIVAAIFGLVTFVNKSNQMDTATIMQTIAREDSHKIGEGEVQLVEFGDYQCPACAQAHPTVNQLKEEFEGKITFVFRHFPLSGHPNAQPAAEAAEAAAAQGKFWEMHDKLFETQAQWSPMADPTSIFINYAEELKLDIDAFREDITEKAHQSRIFDDQSDGYDVSVTGTPTFFVNGKVQSRFDYDSLKNAIQAELNQDS